MTSPGSFFPINNTTNTEFNRIRLDRTKTSTDSQRSMTRHQREKAGLVHACGPLFHTPQLPKAPPISWDAPRRFTVRCFGAVRAWTQKVDISLLHPYRVVGVCNSSRNNRSCLCASLLWWSGAMRFWPWRSAYVADIVDRTAVGNSLGVRKDSDTHGEHIRKLNSDPG